MSIDFKALADKAAAASDAAMQGISSAAKTGAEMAAGAASAIGDAAKIATPIAQEASKVVASATKAGVNAVSNVARTVEGTKPPTSPSKEGTYAGNSEGAVSNASELYNKALDVISKTAALPIIKVNREDYLRDLFKDSPNLDLILDQGPQTVHSPDELRKIANRVIMESTTKTAATSFLSGLPSNPALMMATGGADVIQYFGFAINLAQKIAYLFGEEDLRLSSDEISDATKARIIACLGVMMGAAGAAGLISKTSIQAGSTVGKKLAAQALTKTSWFPLLKKVGALIGQKITKKTVEKTVTKAVPVIGGVVSGTLTFVTFKPMGEKLADAFADNLRGDAETSTPTEDDEQRNPDHAMDNPSEPIDDCNPIG